MGKMATAAQRSPPPRGPDAADSPNPPVRTEAEEKSGEETATLERRRLGRGETPAETEEWRPDEGADPGGPRHDAHSGAQLKPGKALRSNIPMPPFGRKGEKKKEGEPLDRSPDHHPPEPRTQDKAVIPAHTPRMAGTGDETPSNPPLPKQW